MSTTTAEHRIPLGKSGLSVSPICYGSWQLSPRFWGDQPEDVIMDAMRKAFDVGINFYDTADAYGNGYSEEVMGKALADLPREQLVVATKLYHHFYPDGHRHGDLSHDYVLEECDASLKRLNMDYLDLYQCHSWDAMTPIEETVEAMEKLVKAGKIRAYGTSNWTVEQLRLGQQAGNFSTNQPPYSLLRRDIESDILPYCHAVNIGSLVYSPLQTGILSGKYTGTETFDDFRANSPYFQGERFKKICDAVKQVGEIGSGYGLSTVQTVIVATLMHPDVTCAIVGIKNDQQIADASGAMGKSVSRDDWYKIRDLLSV